MKKIMVVLVGVFCLAAILVVSFFGTLPYTKEANIYCDYIVMQMPEIYRDPDGGTVYQTKTRPDDSEIKIGDEWFDNNYNYRIQISNIGYIINNLNSKLELNCEARTNKTGKVVTDDKLRFYCIEPTKTDYLKIDNNTITFDKDKYPASYTSMTVFTFKVQSNDAHKKFINIRMQIKAVESEDTL